MTTGFTEGHRLGLQIRRMISGERAHTLHVRVEERFDGRVLPLVPILGVSRIKISFPVRNKLNL